MKIGELEITKDTLTEINLDWKIPGFSLLTADNKYDSPFFKFLNLDWFISIYPFHNNFLVTVKLMPRDCIKRTYHIMCTFGTVNAEKTNILGVKSCRQINFTARNIDIEDFPLFKREEMTQRKEELLPQDILTVKCFIKQIGDPMKLMELNISMDLWKETSIFPVYEKEFRTLSDNMKNLFTTKEFCDVTMLVKDKEFKAHKAIIAARSSIFAAMFKHDTSENQTGLITIPDCDPESFQEFLHYLYCGKLQNTSFGTALHLFKIADKYGVEELAWFCMDCIRHDMNVENFFDVVALFELYDNDRLFNVVHDFFVRNLNKIFRTVKWKELLKSNTDLANKLLIEMSSNVEIARKRPRLEVA